MGCPEYSTRVCSSENRQHKVQLAMVSPGAGDQSLGVSRVQHQGLFIWEHAA
jgi:hypothetical protein